MRSCRSRRRGHRRVAQAQADRFPALDPNGGPRHRAPIALIEIAACVARPLYRKENNVSNQINVRDTLQGLGLRPDDLVGAEAASWRRFIPGGKLPWKELTSFEDEILRLEERQRALEEERTRVNDDLRAAPERDLERLAQWERGGRRGPRPEPTLPKLEAELARLQEEMLGLHRAIDQATAERADYVVRNRQRLSQEAREGVERAEGRAMRALSELEEARAALVAARRVETWARLYPAEEAGREPAWALLAGGLRRVSELMGLQNQVAADQVLAALREDVTWITGAARPEQRAKLEESRPVSAADVDRVRNQQLSDALEIESELARDRREADPRRRAAKRKALAEIEAMGRQI